MKRSIILIIFIILLCSACGIPDNYDYSPVAEKGVWECSERGILLNFDTQFGEIDNGTDHLIVKQTFQVHTNRLNIYYAASLPEEGFAFDKEKTYIFECTFYNGYFTAEPYEDYDLFKKGEELLFEKVEDTEQDTKQESEQK